MTNTEADANPSADGIAGKPLPEENLVAEVSETAANVDEQKPEEMSIANLLVSEASESVKKPRYVSCFYQKNSMSVTG